MSFNLINFSGSQVYKNYENFYSSSQIVFANHSPFASLKTLANSYDKNLKPLWKDFSISDNITGFVDILPYFFTKHGCLDAASDINNSKKNVDDLKIPINYFSDGRMFGLDSLVRFIKNAGNIQDPTIYSSDINSAGYFLLELSKKLNLDNFTLKENNIESALDYIFSNTYFQFFINTPYQVKLNIDTNNINYSKIGTINSLKSGEYGGVTYSKGYDVYSSGRGEAPNFLNISVNSYQKVKDKILLSMSPITTDYTSSEYSEKQIFIKDIEKELLSAFLISPLSSAFISSISNKSIKKIINIYIKYVILYLNLIHTLLRNSVVDYLFFKQYLSDYQNIFSFNFNGQTVKGIFDSFANSTTFKNQELITYLPTYTRDLMINLLNIVGDQESVSKFFDEVINLMEENEPYMKGNYDRELFKGILKDINNYIHFFYKDLYQVNKNYNNITIQNYNIGPEITHSHDIILEKIYVYRMLEKPSSYGDILQDPNLYKIFDYQNGFSFIDNIVPNTKYYYCFVSQREYDIYKEIFQIDNKNKIVEHFSSPTKILELEMISTENSTYLDYNFFKPKNEEYKLKIKNFLSKIRISPSDEQKNLYNSTKRDFDIGKGLLKFWEKTEKQINSEDLTTGLTLKLRLSSPKTKRKFDINLRHFINDQFQFGDPNFEVDINTVLSLAGDKKVKEVFSIKQPIVKLTITDEAGKEIVSENGDKNKIILKYRKQYEDIYSYKNPPSIKTNISFENDFTIPGSNNKYSLTSYKNVFIKINIYKNNKLLNSYFLDPVYNGKLITDLLNSLSYAPSIKNPTEDLSLKMYVDTTDIFGFNFKSNEVTVEYKNITPEGKIYLYKYNKDGSNKLINYASGFSIDEGQSLQIVLSDIKNLDENQTLYWQILPHPQSSVQPSIEDFSQPIKGTFIVVKGSSSALSAASAKVEIKSDNLTEFAQENFKVKVYLKSDYSDLLTESDVIKINDVSKSPPVYIINGPDSVSEGQTFYVGIQTQNVSNGSSINWKIIFPQAPDSANSNDFVTTNFNGTVTIENDYSTSTVALQMKNDKTTEGAEYFLFNIYDTANNLLNSKKIKIEDTSINAPAEYTVFLSAFAASGKKDSVDEGQNAIFYVGTSNVLNGTLLNWKITPSNLSDFKQITSLEGSFTVGGNGYSNSVSIPVNNDFFTEGPEDYNFEVYLNKNLVATKKFTINDTSLNADTTKKVEQELTASSNPPQSTGGFSFGPEEQELSDQLTNYGLKLIKSSSGELTAKIKAPSQSYINSFNVPESLGPHAPLTTKDNRGITVNQPGSAASVWGGKKSATIVDFSGESGIYTSDSNFKEAIVHAELANADQEITVIFKFKGNLPSFSGSINNKIKTKDYSAKSWNGWTIKKK